MNDNCGIKVVRRCRSRITSRGIRETMADFARESKPNRLQISIAGTPQAPRSGCPEDGPKRENLAKRTFLLDLRNAGNKIPPYALGEFGAVEIVIIVVILFFIAGAALVPADHNITFFR